jgi:O-succinylbenzoic acid--CoA ligase
MGATEKDLKSIDWESSTTEILLNPRWPENELRRLRQLTENYFQPAHVWVASSGSSASSTRSVKLMALPRSAFLASARAVNQHLHSHRDDIWAQVLPRFHVGGLGIEARAFLSGAKVVNALAPAKEGGGQWSATYFLEICQQWKVSLSALVPTQIFDLVSLGVSAPPSLRAIVVGGAALSDELYHQALDLGWPLLPSYGLTETCSQVATASLEGLAKRDRRLHLLEHVRARTNDAGFLEFSGGSLLTGYAQWCEGQEIFVDPKTSGWLSTQDRGEIAGQFLLPLGRDSEFVKISGEGVNLSRLNETLMSVVQKVFPSAVDVVREVVVIAVPEARTENRIDLVVGTERLSAADILQICQQYNSLVAPYEKISRQHFVNEIPRSSLGKVLWAQLREQLRVR